MRRTGTRRLTEGTKANARRLRKDLTDAESRLWYHLRRHGLSGYKFRRQHPFGPYILDFYCPQARLAVEVDGAQHLEPSGQMSDANRTSYLEQHGVTVIRFTNTEALEETDEVLERIYEALGAPLPNPLPSGEREQA